VTVAAVAAAAAVAVTVAVGAPERKDRTESPVLEPPSRKTRP
jgi:hypothetical protein